MERHMAEPVQHPDAVIRRFEDRDYPAVVAVTNAVFPDRHETVEEWRYDDEHFDQRCVRQRFVAEDPATGAVAGEGDVRNMQWAYHPHKFVMDIRVHPAHRRRGIGSALWTRIEDLLRGQEAVSVKALVWEAQPEGVAFVARRGFQETMRAWESRLAVGTFDVGRFAPYVEMARSGGVTITTLADERAKDEGNLARIHAMETELAYDVPRPADEVATPLDYPHWLKHAVEAPWAITEAFFLAVVDGEYAGVSNLFKPQRGEHLYQGLTGVRRAYRGRHIATALKVRTVEYARDRGVREIRTWNEIHNAPILTINEKFGFVRQPAWITFVKTYGEG